MFFWQENIEKNLGKSVCSADALCMLVNTDS